jgi:hypothetical protein
VIRSAFEKEKPGNGTIALPGWGKLYFRFQHAISCAENQVD